MSIHSSDSLAVDIDGLNEFIADLDIDLDVDEKLIFINSLITTRNTYICE